MEKHELIEVLKAYKGESVEWCENPIRHGFDLSDEVVDALIDILEEENGSN